MGFKMPKLSMPNLKLPNNSTKGMDRVQKFFTNNKVPSTNGILSDAKSKIPGPLQKIMPNGKVETSADLNIQSIMNSQSMDVNKMISDKADVNSILKDLNTNDFGISDSMFDISKLKNMKIL